MINELQQLVEVESPSSDEKATARSADAVTELGERHLGTSPERTGNHLVWRHGPTRILLLGHHDTVWPIGTLERWPFRMNGTRATGPGCFDMKAGLVQMFHALATLPSLDGITVVVNADEEIGSPSSQKLIGDAVSGATAALVCEPSAAGALKTARKGIARYELRITGRAAHTGLDPARGINAGVELAHQTIAVAHLGGGDTTVTPTVLRAGTTTNTVPADASLTVRLVDYGTANRVNYANSSGGIVRQTTESCWGESTAADDACYFDTVEDVVATDHAVLTRGWLEASHFGSLSSPTPLEPGTWYTMTVRFQPHDFVLATGHVLGLVVSQSDRDYTSATSSGATVQVDLAGSRLTLPFAGPVRLDSPDRAPAVTTAPAPDPPAIEVIP
ncbi:hypothetical protein GCM10009558_064730 [Virgisporangium aurantiacum]